MKLYKLLSVIVLAILLHSCEDKIINPNELFSLTIAEDKKSFKTEDQVGITVTSLKGKPIESVSYMLDDKNIAGSGNTATINLANKKMGKRKIKATIKSENDTYIITREITITATERPKLYTYEILESYPHDRDAFTQGLEFKNDTLYESTGLRKKSSLRKTNYKTGEILNRVDLADQYFGEGLTILNNEIYQLTWQSNSGFIYDLDSFEKKGTFVYGSSKEGWGLCNDGKKIYKSDGTQKIWTLNPENLSEESFIEIYTNKAVVDNVNELEWVEGKIYANIFQASAIAVVNPKNGAVEGVIDLNGLKDEVTQHSQLDVLNGIAYNGEPNILYLTGKNWDKLFKVKIIEK